MPWVAGAVLLKKKKKKAPHPQPNKKNQTKTFLAISVTQEAFHCQWELRLGGTSSMKTAFDIAFPAVEGGLGEEKIQHCTKL